MSRSEGSRWIVLCDSGTLAGAEMRDRPGLAGEGAEGAGGADVPEERDISLLTTL
jgi:hypothetical protein